MNRYVAGIAYDGGAYFGWQRQRDRPTVQAELESAISRIANHSVTLTVAGRTDRGVHASAQVISFATSAERTPAVWQRGINGLTSAAIRLHWIQPAPANFHPRYSAVARRYLYVFADHGAEPFLNGYCWSCEPLDADAMHRAAQQLVGEHDFSSFRGAGCQSLTPMRRINHCRVLRQGAFVVLDIEANAFLLHMVRNIASALQAVGRGVRQPDIRALLQARDRTVVGPTAPPQGLYLSQVHYPQYQLPAGRAPFFLGLK